MQQHTAALNRVAPGRKHRLALGARTQPFGNPVNEQIAATNGEVPGAQLHRSGSGQCVECAREGAAAWRDENQKHIAAYYKSYFAKPDRKQKRLEYMRAYRHGLKGNASTG
jgi:hypothetical protein